MKIHTVEGFIWAVVKDGYEAECALDNDLELYSLFEDGSESLITDNQDLTTCFENCCTVGFELGFESVLLSEWYESREKTFESRSFERWLEDKANSLIQ